MDGIAAGIWRRSRTKGRMTIAVEPFDQIGNREMDAITAELGDMGRFLELDARLVIESPTA